MLNFLFIPALVSYNFLTFGLKQYLKISPDLCTSLSIITNSLLVSTSSYLYLQNKITIPTMINSFQFTLAFMANDIWFRKYYDLKQGFSIKILHHVIVSLGIYYFPKGGFFLPTLFISDISNIPLEIINIMSKYNYNKYGIKNIMIGLLYCSFGYFRIYKLPQCLYILKYEQMFKITHLEYFFISCIYTLWCYWFLTINLKIYKLFKQKLLVMVSNKISNYFIKKN